MKKLALILILGCIVFFAGCIRQEEKVTGVATGVIVKSFSPDVSEIFGGEEATFTMELENVGEEDANNVRVEFFGLGAMWSPQTGHYDVGFLSKAQPQYKIPGGTATAQFTSKSSEINVDTTYTLTGRVKYEYKTSAYGEIKVYNRSYLKTLTPAEQEKITKSSGIASFSVTKAPVTISLIGVARPYFVDGIKSATVTIQIGNIGAGQPYWSQPGDRNISITKLKVNNKDCEGITPGKIITLPRTGYKTISCPNVLLPSTDTYTTFPIEVEINYKYFVDASTSIKVLKLPA